MSRCVCDGFIESSLLGKVFQAVDGYVGLTLQIGSVYTLACP
jgi:hypothetical protein